MNKEMAQRGAQLSRVGTYRQVENEVKGSEKQAVLHQVRESEILAAITMNPDSEVHITSCDFSSVVKHSPPYSLAARAGREPLSWMRDSSTPPLCKLEYL